MAAGEWDAVLGIRRDVDLNQRWWHRLFKVVYFLTLGLVVAGSAFIIWDESEDLPARRGQVRVLTSLGKELFDADESVPNVVTTFLKRDGKLGYDDGSRKLQKISDFDLERSLCSPAPLKHTEVIAAFLNERSYTTTNTWETVTDGILKGRKPEDTKYLCWMQTSLREKDIHNIIKYEFTTRGFLGALWDYSFPFIAWIGSIHMVLLNVYYRGVVFVIVGPRKKIPPPSDDDDIDDTA